MLQSQHCRPHLLNQVIIFHKTTLSHRPFLEKLKLIKWQRTAKQRLYREAHCALQLLQHNGQEGDYLLMKCIVECEHYYFYPQPRAPLNVNRPRPTALKDDIYSLDRVGRYRSQPCPTNGPTATR